jgi:IS5 family transposase
VQEKAITFPTDAKLLNRARVMLVKLAKKHGLVLRQGYPRVGKLALMKHQRYAHARQFKRANRQLRRLRTFLGRVIRDIERQVQKNPLLNGMLRTQLFLAGRVLEQKRGQRGRKVYSIHAPEVECIGKGKAHKPYEFGVKVSVATPVAASRGGQFVLAAKALPGNPYDGHTLSTVIPHVEKIIGNEIKRIIADKGYRGQWCASALRHAGLRLGAEARRHQGHQARPQTTGRRRARHRTHEERAPDGPQLPPRLARRCQQCHPRRHRLQLRPSPRLAEAAFARPNTGRHRRRTKIVGHATPTCCLRAGDLLHGRLEIFQLNSLRRRTRR